MLSVAMASNGEYDRAFITGVLSTGIYCLPSCRARKPKPENIQFFETAQAARDAGLRACKKCRPDDFLEGIDQELDRLERAVSEMRTDPGVSGNVDCLCERLSCGSSKLFEQIRSHYHTTPGELLAQARVDKACSLLCETEDGIAEIAFSVGFESLSTFYDHFGRLTGLAPSAYRKLSTAQNFKLSLPLSFQKLVVLRYFGRDSESVSERVRGDEITFAANGAAGPMVIRFVFTGQEIDGEVQGGCALEAHPIVVRVLGLKQDPKSFELHAAKLGHQTWFEGREGLRMPLTPSLYDGVVWSIVGQQVNLAFAYALRRRLTELVGRKLEFGLLAPPLPSDVANLAVEDLLPLKYSRRKAEYLIDLSRLIVSGQVNLDQLALGTATRAERTLLAVRGLGPWSVHYLLMRAFGFADCVPLGDTGITSSLQRQLALDARPDSSQTKNLLAPFSPYRTLACLHLWQSQSFES